MSKSIDRAFVQQVGGSILASQLAGIRDPAAIDNGHLDRLADMSVRAALSLDAAIPRAEDRLATEAKAAADAEAAAKQAADAEKKALADEEKAAAKASKK